MTTGWYATSEILGTDSKESVAAGFGYKNKARATKGNWIVLAYRDEDRVIKRISSAQAGVTEGIKPDTWYALDADGKFVEAA